MGAVNAAAAAAGGNQAIAFGEELMDPRAASGRLDVAAGAPARRVTIVTCKS
jgi:hypothetical protein